MAIKPEYIFKIAVPYEKKAEDVESIAEGQAESKKWGDAYGVFKHNIREYLKQNQDGRCAFCRCIISVGTSDANLEHLVPKGDYPQFEFDSINLAYACWPCNRSKKKENTIVDPIEDKLNQDYPENGDEFNIVNPHYDDYELYITFWDDVIILPIGDSDKGRNTIQFYNLTRPKLAEQRVIEFNLNQLQVKRMLMQRLSGGIHPETVIDQVNEILIHLPRWAINKNQ